MREDFLGYSPLPRQDATIIALAILSQRTMWGLQANSLMGQGSRGVSEMSGKVSGVQKRLQELYPRATYTHCKSHTLNLIVVYACSSFKEKHNAHHQMDCCVLLRHVCQKRCLEGRKQNGRTTKNSRDRTDVKSLYNVQMQSTKLDDISPCFFKNLPHWLTKLMSCAKCQ